MREEKENAIELEMRIAHLEYTLDQLDRVIVEMRDRMEAQERELLLLRNQLLMIASPLSEGKSEPPPHY